MFKQANLSGRANALPLPSLQGRYLIANTPLPLNDSRIDPESLRSALAGGQGKFGYISDVLKDAPEEQKGLFEFLLTLPADRKLFGELAGHEINYTGLVFYPTPENNGCAATTVSLPDSLTADLPNDSNAKGMPTLFTHKTFPLIIFSHGYASNPLCDVNFFKNLASHGFVVMTLFHGDLRFRCFTQQQAIRVLSFHQAVAALKQHPVSKTVEFNSVGLLGVSFGGSAR